MCFTSYYIFSIREHLKLDLFRLRPFRNPNTKQLHRRYHPQNHNLNQYCQIYCVKACNIYIENITDLYILYTSRHHHNHHYDQQQQQQ